MDRQVIHTEQELIEWLKGAGDTLSLDTETTDLKYYQLECLGISLCDGKRACYIVLGDKDGQVGLVDYLRHRSVCRGRCVAFHNAPFDLKVLHKLGIEPPENVICTMTAAHLLDEEGDKGLKDLAIRYLHVPEDQVKHYEEVVTKGVNSTEFYDYAMNDAIWTWQLWQVFKPLLEEQGLSNLFYNIEMPFQFVLRDLEINGVQIDQPALVTARESLRKELMQACLDTWEAGGIKYDVALLGELIPEINLNSPKQLVEFIQTRLGVRLTPEEDGGYSVDKSVLESLKDRHPFFGKLLYYRSVEKLANSFFEKLPECIDGDGRIRCHFNNTVTVTGRLSSSDPNMQQLPKKGTALANVRALIIAPPGKVLVGGDWSGQELRVLAEVSRDLTMIDAFIRGQDVHLTLANGFMDLGINEKLLYESHPQFQEIRKKYKDQRDKCKTINFGIPYGKTAYGFALDWNVTEAEAQAEIDKYFSKFPRIQEAIQGCTRRVKSRGFVANLFGRRRRFKHLSKRAFRQAFNFLIQGASADMFKLGAVAVRKLFLAHEEWGGKIILAVHDEIVTEVNEQYRDVVMKDMKYALEHCVSLCVPVVCDIGWGHNYADCK